MWGKTGRTGFVQPGEKVAQGTPVVTMVQYLQGGHKVDENSLFTRCPVEKTRGDGCKLPLRRPQLDTRGKPFTMRTITRWNNLPKAAVESPAKDAVKIRLERGWASLSRPGFAKRGGTRWSWGPFRPGVLWNDSSTTDQRKHVNICRSSRNLWSGVSGLGRRERSPVLSV